MSSVKTTIDISTTLKKKKKPRRKTTSLTKEDGKIVHEPKQILEEEGFFQRNLSS